MDLEANDSQERVTAWQVLLVIVLAFFCAWLLVFVLTKGAVVRHHAEKGPVEGCIRVMVPNEETGQLDEKDCSLYTSEQLLQMEQEPQFDAPYQIRGPQVIPEVRK